MITGGNMKTRAGSDASPSPRLLPLSPIIGGGAHGDHPPERRQDLHADVPRHAAQAHRGRPSTTATPFAQWASSSTQRPSAGKWAVGRARGAALALCLPPRRVNLHSPSPYPPSYLVAVRDNYLTTLSTPVKACLANPVFLSLLSAVLLCARRQCGESKMARPPAAASLSRHNSPIASHPEKVVPSEPSPFLLPRVQR